MLHHETLKEVPKNLDDLREALWVSLRLIKPVTDEIGCQIVYID